MKTKEYPTLVCNITFVILSMPFFLSKGIIDKVDYFKSINVGAVWLSPIFSSPQDDFGYDISNFKMIDPLYGTMADFERLRTVFHNNGTYLNFLF